MTSSASGRLGAGRREPGQPLAGLSIVVTRSADQAGELAERLAELGAEPIEIPSIAIARPLDQGEALKSAWARIDTYDRIVVASPNGARALLATAPSDETDEGVPVACVGPRTAKAFEGSRLRVDIVPEHAVAEHLVEAIGPASPAQSRALLVQAEVARSTLPEGLVANGWHVDQVVAYRAIDADIDHTDRCASANADVITFMSSSTFERFLRLAGSDALPSTIASIGPITSATIRHSGYHVAVEADPHTTPGLVDALVRWATSDR